MSVAGKVVLAVMIWLLCAAAILKVVGGHSLIRFTALSERGVEVRGTVVGLEPLNHRLVSYRYSYGGREHAGQGGAGYGNPEFDALAVGADVLVFVDPRDPQVSVLGQPRMRLGNERLSVGFAVILGATLITIRLMFVLLAASKRRAEKRRKTAASSIQ